MQKLIIPFVFLFLLQAASAQFFGDNKGIKKLEGFFDVHYEDKTGKVWMVIPELMVTKPKMASPRMGLQQGASL